MDKNLFLPVLKFSLQRDRPRNLKNGGASQGNVEFFAVILHLISSFLLPESTADERRRSEIYNLVPSLDYLNKALGKKALI